MTPYKDPDTQRAYQANWQADRRREWLGRQRCSLCGGQANLRVFRHIGAPKLGWTRQGPSHRKFRVVCGDPEWCLRRRAKGAEVPTPPTLKERNRTKYEHRKLRALHPPSASPVKQVEPKRRRGRPKGSGKPTKPKKNGKRIEKESKPRRESKLTREVREPDHRPRCPTHGPRNTFVLGNTVRFVCCGRVLSTIKPKKWGII